MERSQIISFIKDLTDKELVDLLYDSFEGRNIFREESSWSENKLVLCNASREKNEDGTWSEWGIELLAREDKNVYPEGWAADAPICQEGQTEGGFKVFGWAKKMKCPITGGSIHGT